MVLYASLFLIAVAGGYIGKVNRTGRRRAIYLATVAAVLIFLAACRSENIGADTLQFTTAYRTFAAESWHDALSHGYEKGFLFLCRLLACISPSPQLLIIFTSVFSIGVFMLVLYRNSRDVVMSVALFIGMQYYANYMNYMRQVLAITIAFLAIEFLLKKFRFGWIPYLAAVLLAATFHLTVLILCVLPLFYYLRPTRRLCCAAGALGLAAFILFNLLIRLAVWLFPKYRPYIGGEYLGGGGGESFLGITVCLAVFLSLLWVVFFRKTAGAVTGEQTPESSELPELPEVTEVTKTAEATGTSATPEASESGVSEASEASATPEATERSDAPAPAAAYGAGYLFWCSFASLVLETLVLRAIVMGRLSFYFRMYATMSVPLFLASLPRKGARIVRIAVLCLALAHCILVLCYRQNWTQVAPYEFFWSATTGA